MTSPTIWSKAMSMADNTFPETIDLAGRIEAAQKRT
jgi:hypothetical protein